MDAWAATDKERQPVPNANLVDRVKNGDSEAFAILYTTYRSRVYALCLRMTGNIAEAEDLTQDTFFQVLRKISTFRGESSLSTWLYRVTVNTVLMHFRKHSVRHISYDESPAQEAPAPPREYGTADVHLNCTLDRIALFRVLQELPPGYRRVFLLHEVHGYEHHEIAARLRCTVGNSKSQLHKARMRIRELLQISIAPKLKNTRKSELELTPEDRYAVLEAFSEDAADELSPGEADTPIQPDLAMPVLEPAGAAA